MSKQEEKGAADEASQQQLIVEPEELDLSCYKRKPKDGINKSYFISSSGWKSATELGCKHYRRNCELFAECCEEWFVCRLCHDEKHGERSHQINRYQTRIMRCMFCGRMQCASQKCEYCSTEMARYFCNHCKFWDNDPDKHLFHCDKCLICRVGKREHYVHCDKCEACLGKDFYKRHECTAKSLKCGCPVCNEWMHNSVRDVTFWQPCEHPLHFDCLEAAFSMDMRCPHPHCRVDYHRRPQRREQMREENDEEDEDEHEQSEDEDGTTEEESDNEEDNDDEDYEEDDSDDEEMDLSGVDVTALWQHFIAALPDGDQIPGDQD